MRRNVMNKISLVVFTWKKQFTLAVLACTLILGSSTSWAWALDVSPLVALPTMSVNVSGQNYPSNKLIDVLFDAQSICTSKTDANGSFGCAFNIPNSSKVGAHLVSAFVRDTHDGQKTKVIVADVTEAFGVAAEIDGLDQLILQENTMQWNHLDFAAPGRLAGVNAPTFIMSGDFSTTNGYWIPEWSAPPPAEIRQPELSSILTELPTLKTTSWYVQKIIGRGEVTIVEQPLFNNKLIIQLDDYSYPGAMPYAIRLYPLPDISTDQLLDISKDLCKNKGWINYNFKNQGECIKFVDVWIKKDNGHK